MKLPNMPKVLSNKEFELVRLVFRHQLYNRDVVTSPLISWCKGLSGSIMAGKDIHGYILDRAIAILREDLSLPERKLNDICINYRRHLLKYYFEGQKLSEGANPKRFIFNHTYYKFKIYNAIHNIPTYGINGMADLLNDIKHLTDVISKVKANGMTQRGVVKLLFEYPKVPEQTVTPRNSSNRADNRLFIYTPINQDTYDLEVWGHGYLFRKLIISPEVLDPTNLALYNYGRDRNQTVQDNIIKLIELNDIIYRLHRRNDKRATKFKFLKSLTYIPKNDYDLHERIRMLMDIFQTPSIDN